MIVAISLLLIPSEWDGIESPSLTLVEDWIAFSIIGLNSFSQM